MKLSQKIPADFDLPLDYNGASPALRKAAREKCVVLQNNKCHFCDGDFDDELPQTVTDLKIDLKLFPPNFLKHPIHLHHNHDTGMTIGAVHAHCNAILWQYLGE